MKILLFVCNKNRLHIYTGNDCCHQAMKMVFGVQGEPLLCKIDTFLNIYFVFRLFIKSNRLTSVTGAPLTNARTISRTLIHDADRPHPTINLLFMQFGQLLTHDVSHSSSIKTRMLNSIQFNWIRFKCGVFLCHYFFSLSTNIFWLIAYLFGTGDGASIRCCAKDGSHVLPREALHFACLPIAIEPDDEFYSQFDQGCINFVRSALAPDGQCQLSYGKQVIVIYNMPRMWCHFDWKIQHWKMNNSLLILFPFR